VDTITIPQFTNVSLSPARVIAPTQALVAGVYSVLSIKCVVHCWKYGKNLTEDSGGNRTATTATVIWHPSLTNSSGRYLVQKGLSGDLSTMAVEWNSTRLSYQVDGMEFGFAFKLGRESRVLFCQITPCSL